MKKVISFISHKEGCGKTTLAINSAAILAEEKKLKVCLYESSDNIHDSEVYLKTSGDHLYSDNKTLDDYAVKGGGFYLIRAKNENVREIVKKMNDEIDILLIDSGGGNDELYCELSDRIIIPATLTPLDVKYADYTAKKLLDGKYPASIISVLVNKNSNNMLSVDDIGEVFSFGNVVGVLPHSENIKNGSSKGELFYTKGKKDDFIKSLKKSLAFIVDDSEGKDHLKVVNNYKPEKKIVLDIVSEDDVNEKSVKRKICTGDNIELKKEVHKNLFEEIDVRNLEKDALSHPEKKSQIFGEIKKKIRLVLDKVDKKSTDREKRENLINEIYDEVVGYGAIEDLLKDTTVTEIMVNKHDEIFVERKGLITLSDKKFTDDASVLRAIERIVMPLGRRIDESMPYVDARLPDGSRVNAIIPPLALDGPVITIRKFSHKKLVIQDLIDFGSITKEAADYLEDVVKNKKNIIISGGTGSGKTTLLNISSSFIPSNERIVTIEDSAELKLPQEHVVRLESRPPNIEGKGEVTIRDLVKNALRMRPDRIVVGECRGGETLDMLQAMNTGHEGSMTTVHANSPRDALSRIEVLVLMSGVELPLRAIREQVNGAVDVIVQQSRLKDGSRKVTYISELTGMEGDTILMHNVFEFIKTGEDKNGKVLGNIVRSE